MIKILKRYFSFLLLQKEAFFASVLIVVLATVISNLSPYALKLLVNAVSVRDYQLLLYVIVLFAGLKALANALSALGFYLGDKVAIPVSINIRQKIFQHVQELDFKFHTDKKTGSLVSVFKRGDGAFWSLYFNFREILSVAVAFIVTLLFFSQLSFWLVIMTFGLSVVIAILGRFFIKINIKKRQAVNEVEDRTTGIIADNFLNYETVKYFAWDEREQKRLEQNLESLLKRVWAYGNSFRIMDVSIGSVSVFGIFFILLFALKKFKAGDITGGDLVMVSSFTTSFYYSFFRLLYQTRNIAKNFGDIERYFSLLDKEAEIKDPERPQSIGAIKGEIVFDNVVFDYPGGKEEALLNFNLKIEPGQTVAFVGRSGAGKTTVAKLLLRLYNLRGGRILIDGVDISKLKKKQLRRFIGVVPQEPILFNNTIGFNIAFGREESTEQEIKKVAKMANLYDFIESLPNKFQTQVGERGIKLSGGQKQRLAIARMLISNPKIIVFDEATSQLDSESEYLIQDAFWKMAQNKTVLIIAHRLSTLKRADKIVVLENGSLCEQGSHEELIKKEGLYKHLWELQAQEGKSLD